MGQVLNRAIAFGRVQGAIAVWADATTTWMSRNLNASVVLANSLQLSISRDPSPKPGEGLGFCA